MPVEVQTLTGTKVEEASEYVANLVSRRSVTIYPVVSGYVLEIVVKPGKEVKAGERLIRIDARQEAAALTQTRAALNQAETQLALATTHPRSGWTPLHERRHPQSAGLRKRPGRGAGGAGQRSGGAGQRPGPQRAAGLPRRDRAHRRHRRATSW